MPLSNSALSPSPIPVVASGSHLQKLLKLYNLHRSSKSLDERALPLFRLSGTFAGHPATFLLDCGASNDFVDTEFVRRHAIPCGLSDRWVKLADGKLSRADGALRAGGTLAALTPPSVPVPFDRVFTMTPLAGYDALLGMPWLRDANPRVDWQNRRVVVTGSAGELDLQLVPDAQRPFNPADPRPVRDEPAPSEADVNRISVVSTQVMERSFRAGEVQSMYLLIVRSVASPDGAPPTPPPPSPPPPDHRARPQPTSSVPRTPPSVAATASTPPYFPPH